MKFKFLLTLMLLTTLSPLSHAAVTINWGSEAFSTLLDSKGVPLDSSYVFQLGVFTTTTQSGTVPYVPQLTSLDDWASHWKVFDKADFNSIVDNGQTWSTFSSTVVLNNNGAVVNGVYFGGGGNLNNQPLRAVGPIQKRTITLAPQQTVQPVATFFRRLPVWAVDRPTFRPPEAVVRCQICAACAQYVCFHLLPHCCDATKVLLLHQRVNRFRCRLFHA